MRGSFTLGRIAGIDIKVHVTFFLLLAWIAFVYERSGGMPAAINGVLFVLLIFLLVVLHEFGHALAARRYGIETRDITLLPIGGLARLERMPDKPREEVVVALAGPAVNVVIAAALALFIGFSGGWPDPHIMEQTGVPLAFRLFSVNVWLVLFNMIPAFPMDGGRVLRAVLAMRMNYAAPRNSPRASARVSRSSFSFSACGRIRCCSSSRSSSTSALAAKRLWRR